MRELTPCLERLQAVIYKSPFTEVLDDDHHEAVPLEGARRFECGRAPVRHPRETRGREYDVTIDPVRCCEPGDCC